MSKKAESFLSAPRGQLTSSWSAVYHHSKQFDELRGMAFLPVRISVGLPRFWRTASSFPYLKELAPVGIRGVKDPVEFDKRYVEGLERVGVDEIQALFDELHDSYLKPLMLLCYEKLDTSDPAAFDRSCHRRTFAKWWHEKTGRLILEADGLEADDIQRLLA